MTNNGIASVQRERATLRAAARDDLPAIEKLLSAGRLPVAGVESTIGNFLVAESRDELVGAIGLELYGSAALLRSVVVADSVRGTGLGAQLVNEIIREADEKGVRQVFLLTTTAEHYFPRFGFERITRDEVPESVKQSVEFRGACPASAIVMMREVLPPAK